MKLGGRYDVTSEVDGMRAPLHGLEFHVDDAVEFPQFRRLVAVDLVDVRRLPVWLVGASKTGIFNVYTANKDSEAVFQEVVAYCDFERGEIVGFLLETDDSQRYVVLFPRLEEDHVEIKGVVLDLDNEFVRRAERLAGAAVECEVPSDAAAIVEAPRLRRENSVLDNYLQKRNSQPPQAPRPAPREHNVGEKFNRTVERLAAREVRRLGVQAQLSKDECKELYGIALKSARFLFRRQLRQQQEPPADKLANVVRNTIQLHLEEL
ncbi:hypothetical protein KL933_004395 [Ogataea haglerorum]|uniref:Sld7 C-terminal domain-containing protein n=1 Tax=Ogataea haglerorum TaxID=1937702 RepID=A0AAN6D236_9ASCO|nr:hypothetical protein KL915_001534 [Ogataea haglerorum]KAG7710284.1 hypothetical protein KL914_001194 [Ogataea haglerorum]KAG7724962.1 hypothetical protein KL933_004395 [Ogataea haglerorum]KAG7737156.1 hypothetical protein KL932_004116 [Ogataea haglerorum]KAG7741113.1 hypothetical protein KL923_001754 [Ogataea haglerorum]